MTREELKAHCEKQIEMCEYWANARCEKPSGKVYEEHKLILELLEQERFMNKPCVAHQVCHEDKIKVLDKIKEEIEQYRDSLPCDNTSISKFYAINYILGQILDKYINECEV